LLEKIKNIEYPRGNTIAKVISSKITMFTREIIKPYSNNKKIQE